PGLFIHEYETIYWEQSVAPAITAQIRYASNQDYSAWGLSDCFDIDDGGYLQQGSFPAASPNIIETRRGLISAHASALALPTSFRNEASKNLQELVSSYPSSYDEQYG